MSSRAARTMIASFHIRNFKSYRDATLPLAPLTLLVGANASGKSNALEAVRLLTMLATGRRLSDLRSAFQSSEDEIRGNAASFSRTVHEPIGVGCDLEEGEWNALRVDVRFERDWSVIEDEAVFARSGRQLYGTYSEGLGGARYIEVSSVDVPEESYFAIPVTDQQAIFTQLGSPAAFPPGSYSETLIPAVADAFRETLNHVFFFDLHPRQMRGYSYTGEQALKEDGSNLSAVVYGLCKFTEGTDALLRFMSDLPEQPFVDVGFIVTERGDAMVRLKEAFGDVETVWDAPVLSDGTLRVLGIAAALLSAEPGSTIIIEEIDNGVHPSRAESLLRNIERVARERDLRVLLTTHNPALLDRLPTHAIPHVVCAYRDPDDGDSRLVRLQDLPSYPDLVARGPLGQLMTRGVLDYFLKHQQSTGEKQARSELWLEALKAQVGDV